MNPQTGSIEITGLSLEVLSNIEQRAKAAGTTAENYLRTWIEQEYTLLDFSAEQLEELRQAALRGREQIEQGQYRTYTTADEMLDDLEAEVRNRTLQRKTGGSP
jgi:hypothetical protein